MKLSVELIVDLIGKWVISIKDQPNAESASHFSPRKVEVRSKLNLKLKNDKET